VTFGDHADSLMAETNYLLWVDRLNRPDEAILLRPGRAVWAGGGDYPPQPHICLLSPGVKGHFLAVAIEGGVVRIRRVFTLRRGGGLFRLNGRPMQSEECLRPNDRIEAGSESLRLERAPVIDPAWLAWGDAAVLRTAQAVYGGNEVRRLPLLADALEDAGCADRVLLDHLRRPGHERLPRDCWAVDLVFWEATR
jgi:hypothetical protein